MDEAITYALDIIEAYEFDIRHARVHGDLIVGHETTDKDGPSLADLGFCQGSIYTGAVERIKQMASDGKAPPKREGG